MKSQVEKSHEIHVALKLDLSFTSFSKTQFSCGELLSYDRWYLLKNLLIFCEANEINENKGTHNAVSPHIRRCHKNSHIVARLNLNDTLEFRKLRKQMDVNHNAIKTPQIWKIFLWFGPQCNLQRRPIAATFRNLRKSLIKKTCKTFRENNHTWNMVWFEVCCAET